MSSILHLPRSRRFNPRVPLSQIRPLSGLGDDGVTCTDLDQDLTQSYTEPPEAGAGSDASDQPDPPQNMKIDGINYVTFPRGIQNWENIDQDNYALLPAIGASVVIISYVVPPGRNGIIYKVANNFVGGGWVEGTGDIVWRILVDGSPPPGAVSYDTILASLGNPASPTEIAGFRIFENQVLQLVAFNNPAGPDGGVIVAGQRVGARFCGWNYPTDIEDSDIWL
jgi:hypothetical protein